MSNLEISEKMDKSQFELKPSISFQTSPAPIHLVRPQRKSKPIQAP